MPDFGKSVRISSPATRAVYDSLTNMDSLRPRSEWEVAVEEGSRKQTIRRLHNESTKATQAKKEFLANEFELAWRQRYATAQRKCPCRHHLNIPHPKSITLVQEAYLHLLNHDCNGLSLEFFYTVNPQGRPSALTGVKIWAEM